jgi:hypothetical protein
MTHLYTVRIKPIVWFTLFCISTSLMSCAQSRGAFIQNSQAFYKTILPGNNLVGEDGQPVNAKPGVKRFIYIETSIKEPPQIESVLYNGIRTTASIFREEKLPLVIGVDAQGKEVVIQPKSGNVVWRLEIDPSFTSQVNSSTIVIKGKYAGKPFTQSLKKETELQADNTY